VSQSGVVLLDKPAGLTSFEALEDVKRALATRRVGHAGTLDRFATGLLVVMAGPCTRLVRFVQDLEKEYVARLTLGTETETLDPEGRTVRTAPVPDREAIQAAVPRFLGRISQVPPAYSALHVGGRRAHEIARSGGAPELAARTVEIREIAVLDFQPPFLDLRVRCSGGTYIRSLARDLALAAGSCAHVSGLRRTAIGSIRVERAVPPAEFLLDPRIEEPGAFLAANGVLPAVTIREDCLARFRAGRGGPVAELCEGQAPEGEVACLDASRRLVGIARVLGGRLRDLSAIGSGR
jgi:tRNA pseudouridine55 synthase